MQVVTPAYREELARPVCGPALVELEMRVVDVDAAAGAQVDKEDGIYWSDAESTLATEGAPHRSYATFEPGRWKMDGRLHIAPEPGKPTLTEGFVSQEMSDSEGWFEKPPELVLDFASPVNLPGLTLAFDQVAGEWCSQIALDTWKEGRQVESSRLKPDAVVWVAQGPWQPFDRLRIRFERTCQPLRRARVSRIVFGLELVLGPEQLSKTIQLTQVDPVGRRLPTDTLKFTAINTNLITDSQVGRYDPDNPQGIWRYFEQRTPVHIRYGQTITGGMRWGDMARLTWQDAAESSWKDIREGGFVEWLDGGRYYLTGQPTIDGMYAQFEATDAVGILDNTYYKGIWDGKAHSLWDLAQAVLEDAGLPCPEKGVKPWKLWEGLKTLYSTAPLPVTTHRECLQMIAHAGCCVLRTDRQGWICIEPDAAATTGEYISLAQMLEDAPTVEKTAALLQVECPATVYAPEEKASQLHKGTYQVNGRLALHLTWSQAADIAVSCEGAVVASKALYAAAGDLVLEGSGTATLLVEGRKLETSAQNAVAAVENPADNAQAEVLDNPLITDLQRAAAVAGWVRGYLLRRNTYTLTTRGNPELDVLDRVQMDTRWQKRVGAQVIKNQLSYTDGGLKGEMMLKKEEQEQ